MKFDGYTHVHSRKDMWDVLYEAKTWREFARYSVWWMRRPKHHLYKLRVILHAAKSRLA